MGTGASKQRQGALYISHNGKVKLYSFPPTFVIIKFGVNSTAQGFSVEDTMPDDSYFNISKIKLSSVIVFSTEKLGPYYSQPKI